jgi:putative ABC transport system substrate-binding protein
MAARGWKEGFEYIVVERWAGSDTGRLPYLAKELVDMKPALILAFPASSVQALAKLTSTIPIVQASGADLVALGLAKTLAHPGGMITGLTNFSVDVSAKHLELLLTAAPQLRRIGFLSDPTVPNYSAQRDNAERALVRYSVNALFADAKRPEEIAPAIAQLTNEGMEGLVIMASAWYGLANERQLIVNLALSHRWPVIGGLSEYAVDGALMSYGTDRAALFRRAAYYVDRILKGTKPADLPIEQPMTFDLVVNMRTAKALGLKIPNSILVQATKVID